MIIGKMNVNRMHPFSIGYIGEKEVQQIVFDWDVWADAYGEGTLELLVERECDSAPYPATLEVDGHTSVWTITNTETACAKGQIQLVYTSGTKVKKSTIALYTVDNSLSVNTAPPKDWSTWVDELLDVGGAAEGHAHDAQTAASDAQGYANTALSMASIARGYANGASGYASDAQGYANTAKGYKESAESSASDAERYANQITGMSATATTLDAGSNATASYSNGILSLGIPKGADGRNGTDGVGVPVGGMAGQLLQKKSGTDYDVEWVNQKLAVVDGIPVLTY